MKLLEMFYMRWWQPDETIVDFESISVKYFYAQKVSCSQTSIRCKVFSDVTCIGAFYASILTPLFGGNESRQATLLDL